MNYATNVFFHPLIPPFPENNFVKVLQIKRAMTTTQNHHYYEINKKRKTQAFAHLKKISLTSNQLTVEFFYESLKHKI